VVHGDVRKCLAAKVAVGEGGPLIGISSRGEVGRDAIAAGDAVGPCWARRALKGCGECHASARCLRR